MYIITSELQKFLLFFLQIQKFPHKNNAYGEKHANKNVFIISLLAFKYFSALLVNYMFVYYAIVGSEH